MSRKKDQPHMPLVPASVIFGDLLRAAPADRVTLAWLVGGLEGRSFGVVLLLLALLGLIPGVAVLAGALLMVPAAQMVLARRRPVFTRHIASLHLPTRRVVALIGRTIPLLRHFERFVRPRWPTPFESTKRAVGAVVLLLGLCIMLVPIPFSNVAPAIVIALIAFAYLEEDGALLIATLVAALVLLACLAALVWQSVGLARWLQAML
jgi:hypothetical protein